VPNSNTVTQYNVIADDGFIADYETVSVEHAQPLAHLRSPGQIDAKYPLHNSSIRHTHRDRTDSRWNSPRFP